MTKAAAAPMCEPIGRVSRRTIFAAGGSSTFARVLPYRPPRGPTRDITSVAVSEIMTADVVCVAPDLGVDSLLALLIERDISGVPVVDPEGNPLGIVSKTDLLRQQHEFGDTEESEPEEVLESGFHIEAPARATVADYMLPLAFTVADTAPLAHAAALMAWEGVHRVPVCSARGDVVGIITSLDVVRWLADAAGYTPRR